MAHAMETYRGVVYPWNIDHVGHMNVQFYTGKFDEATWHFFAKLGLTPTFLREHNTGMAALDQRTQYKREVLAGSLLVIRSVPLEVQRKTVRFRHTMVDGETDQEIAVTELLGVYMDKALRKSKELPALVVSHAERWLASGG